MKKKLHEEENFVEKKTSWWRNLHEEEKFMKKKHSWRRKLYEEENFMKKKTHEDEEKQWRLRMWMKVKKTHEGLRNLIKVKKISKG